MLNPVCCWPPYQTYLVEIYLRWMLGLNCGYIGWSTWRSLLGEEQRQEAGAVVLWVWREAGDVDEGGRDVDVGAEGVDARARLDARAPRQERDVHVALVRVLTKVVGFRLEFKLG